MGINCFNNSNFTQLQICFRTIINHLSMASDQSLFRRFLAAIDVFSYVPVPQAYPVSTNKSKIGSVLFLCILLGYLIWDFYNFITNNIPTTNAYQQSATNRGNVTIPPFAFGIQYTDPNPKSTVQYIFNNTAYFQFVFQAMFATVYENDSQSIKFFKLPLYTCRNNSWEANVYKNLTCVDLDTIKSMDLPYPMIGPDGLLMVSDWMINKTRYAYDYRFKLLICTGTGCANASDITFFIKNSIFFLFSKQPRGFNYRNGTSFDSTNPKSFRYAFQNDTSNSVGLYVWPTEFQISPNLLTQFKTTIRPYSQILRDAISNFTYKSNNYALRIYWYIDYAVDVVQIHQQTIIDRVSQWSAFASLIFMIAAICFLGYNRKKFNRRNPDWERFDQMLKEKLEVEMQPLGNSAKLEQSQREGQSEAQSKGKQNQTSQQQKRRLLNTGSSL